ncbi:hypothetical protein SCP_0112340 [Sparassis crispa]|uniref:Uncharacterized protein n=1 Tax=Sparassis crispa TaxID=139825 RepID=A0A401G876_9APHY|nr:hypothetical protein SCP_0112340 [Sparassis crispa]GBE78349.1 hypothetical protein SCP_0112340 [Sparassis crispa]
MDTAHVPQIFDSTAGAMPTVAELADIRQDPLTDTDARSFKWELNTFLFRYDVERLAFNLDTNVCTATTQDLAEVWAATRDRYQWVWGFRLSTFPSSQECGYLDSEDDILQLQHWRGLRRLILQWSLLPEEHNHIRLAMGGSVTDARMGILAVIVRTFKATYRGNREPYVFEPRL